MARKEGNKSVNSLWIFCEGDTECNYFTQLRAVDRIRGLQIRPVKSADKRITDIVSYSMKYLDHNPYYLQGDIIVYVFDRDKNTNADFNAVKEDVNITNPSLQLILSNPCFELWILLHFESYSEAIQPQKLKLKLRKHMGAYNKNDKNIYYKTKDNIDAARKHSKKLYQTHMNKNGILCEESNPSTMMFQLIEMIEQYKE